MYKLLLQMMNLFEVIYDYHCEDMKHTVAIFFILNSLI